jgi:undecaprenyl-phosphate galactose phosphotransferase
LPLTSRDLPRKLVCILSFVAGDLLGWLAGLLLALGISRALAPPASGASLFATESLLSLWWFPLLGLVFLAFEGLYTQRRAFWEEVRSLWRAGSLAHVAALPAFLYGLSPSPPILLFSWPILLAALPGVRLGIKRLLFRLGPWRKRALVVGAGPAGAAALSALAGDPVLGYEIVSLHEEAETRDLEVQISGLVSRAPRVFRETGCRDVVLALPDLPQEALLRLIHEFLGREGVESVRVLPGLGFLSLMEVRIDPFLPERLFLVTVADNLAKPWNLWLKRGFDLVIGGAFLLLALPVMGLIAWGVRRDSPGPVLYVRERLGWGGRPFRCYKFRTMYVDGDERLREALAEDPKLWEEWTVYRKLRGRDPRVTLIGRFLRRWSLDELPQLWNVVRGEMSLVGPRPYLPEEREAAGPELGTILQTRPGITGLWQVTGKNELPFRERVSIEAWYVRNWSLWLDLIILLRTVKVVLKREGAQ